MNPKSVESSSGEEGTGSGEDKHGSGGTVEEMSISPTPPPPQAQENVRICLVGPVKKDADTIKAAHELNVPVMFSDTGAEFLVDDSWITYFILHDFDGPVYEAIYKTKHKILGPPALKYAVESGEGLPKNNRPIYNYSFRGAITCFSGLRKKDELVKLVHYIHFMGGSIRKDLGIKITHVICNSSIGEKYQYAMTFRLPALRQQWIRDAWAKRDDTTFSATSEEYLKEYRLKVFEGQKVCFMGFPPEEHQHMVDVLRMNGGISTELDDPECSHVIISNTGYNFSQHTLPPSESPPPPASSAAEPVDTVDSSAQEETRASFMTRLEQIVAEQQEETDGIILVSKPNDSSFLNPNDISPILKSRNPDESLQRIAEEEEEDEDCIDELGDFTTYKIEKRKRTDDSFDNVSLASTDSFAPGSSKKPKLTRTGSITKNLRRSMSFAAIKTPLSNMLRTRRSSVDPNASITSISSINTTFNESIKKPVKEKLRAIKDKITKKHKDNTPKRSKGLITNLDTLKNVCKLTKPEQVPPPPTPDTPDNAPGPLTVGFKTPHAPPNRTPILRHSMTAFSKSTISTSEFITPTKQPPFASTSSSSFAPQTTSPPSSTLNASLVSLCPSTASDVAEIRPVVDEHTRGHTTAVLPEVKSNRTHIVKSDWFWYTIQNGYANEADYLFSDYLDSITNTPGSERRDSYPISFNKRKRKRLSQRLPGTPLSGSGKRRSSSSDAGLLSVSGSLLDYTASPADSKHEISSKIIHPAETSHEAPPAKNVSMRRNHFHDFFHTESNYVGILDTIVKVFKEPLEKMQEADSENCLLNQQELKSVFSNFLPIYEVHKNMLNRLIEIQTNWSEDCLIGQIIIENKDQLTKAYPPYVNFFEQMKETLVQADLHKPRFHAFLKICQAKPECGRQSLQDLMIRPVQRLPSISLLLNDILKHTAKTNPDHAKLNDALKAIKEVMTYINEDKRKTEGRVAMFDIFHEIDNCPPHLVSSHRSFVSRCEVTELSDMLSGRGDSLVLFLFSDTLEVCKKRSRAFGTVKSPGTGGHNALNTTKLQTTKPYKHLKLMPLSSIRYVIDVSDNPRAFAIHCKLCGDSKDKIYSFSICDEEFDKTMYTKTLCKQMAENACRADTDKCFLTYHSEDLGIDISDVNVGTLSKAFKFATRTRLKVGRAFSFNKTPSKLKRAVSTMMTSPFGSTNSLTPSSQMAQMKLASCTNLNDDCNNPENEEENEDVNDTVSQCSSSSPTASEILVAPLSVQPIRKNKNLVSVAALRRI